MRTFRLGSNAIASLGALTDALLDPIYDGLYGHPAIVPAPVLPTSGAIPAFTTTGTWSGDTTTTPNSSATFTFTGFGCQIQLAGNTSAGGIAWVTLDGAPRLAMDTFSASTVTQELLTPAGGQHTVTITYYGDINAGVPWLGSIIDTVGTTVAPLLSAMRSNRATTVSALWTVVALDSTHVSIDGSGSYALGTTVTGVIPGVNLILASGTMVPGDTAQFAVSATGITIAAFYSTQTEASDAAYTSPIVSADGAVVVGTTFTPLPLPDTFPREPIRWLCACWDEDPAHPAVSGSAATGNTLNPADASWSTTPAGPGYNASQLAISHDGLGHGYMGMAVLPRGVYSQVTVNIPAGGFIRGLRVYGWNPDTDPDRNRFPPIPDDDLAHRLYGSLAVSWAMLERDPMRELAVSTSLGAAVNAYADQHGAEWRLPRPYGADDGLYMALLRFIAASRTRGGTLGFFNQALALLLGPNVPFSITSLRGSTSSWILGTSRLGVDTILGSTTPHIWQVQVTVQVRALKLPPQLVQALFEEFRPVGVLAIYVWN